MERNRFAGRANAEKPFGGRMSEQVLDLRRSIHIIRRHKIIVGIAVMLGLLLGVAFTMLRPPMLTSKALVVLPPSASRYIGTQVVIAESDPVLAVAASRVKPPVSLTVIRDRVQVESLTTGIISIGAEGHTADEAENIANAVANSYVTYVSSRNIPGGQVQARVLERAVDATGASLPARLIITGGLGALAGLLIGAIAALAIGRGDRRLWQRDEIAGSIGVSVLASIAVGHPSSASGWTKLIEEYDPNAVDAWRLRQALQYLRQDAAPADGRGSASSLTLLSLSTDRKAIALGPQLAAFAASLGIRTALVIGPLQDTDSAATLRTACAGPQASGARNLQVTVTDHASRLPEAELCVVIDVLDSKHPQFADAIRTATTVLGVSAGAATAEQLARVAACAAADGRPVTGILVADPDPTDQTTGRLPQLARPALRAAPSHRSTRATENRQ
jgi:capsular polysaccharide biosynthesis protein